MLPLNWRADGRMRIWNERGRSTLQSNETRENMSMGIITLKNVLDFDGAKRLDKALSQTIVDHGNLSSGALWD
jgi:hypothetical protein